MTENDFTIDGLGVFRIEKMPSRGKSDIIYLEKSINFCGQSTTLLIHSNPDGSLPTKKDCLERRTRFRALEANVDKAMEDLPPLVRQICDEMQIDHREIPDAQLSDGMVWRLIKLEPQGDIECWTNTFLSISHGFDLMIRFSRQIRIFQVYFDG